MVWDTTRFFTAFAKVGMVQIAYYWRAGDFSSTQINVDLNKPSADVFGEVRACDYLAEYEATAVNLKKGGLLAIGGELFEVTQVPKSMDNGDFKQAELMKLADIQPSFNPAIVPWVVDGADFIPTISQGAE